MRLAICLLLLLSTSFPFSTINSRAQRRAAGAAPATKALHALFDEEWDYEMRENPERASALGDRRFNDRWTDLSIAAINRRHEHTIATLARLKGINRVQLSQPDQINYDLFKRNLENDIEEHEFHLYLLPLNQRGGIQTDNELGDQLRFTTAQDYTDWLARLRAFPVYMDQTMALMREGMREHMMWPKVVMKRVTAQIEKQIVSNPEDSLFYKPFKNFPQDISAATRDELTRDAREAISSGVVPSFKKLQTFYTNEYLPASFDEVGVWQMPRGAELYAFLAREFTTTDMTPQQIHDLGLSEVRRIRGEMQAIMDQLHFNGSLQDFFKFLRTDQRFYYKTPEELFAAYQAMAKRIDPNLIKVFKTLPRMPYGVEPIPAAIAPDTTTAYYRRPAADGSRAGTYFVNLYRPETRPTYEMMALTLHESVPGHHLQIALAMEQGEIPNFRRYGGYTAFVEGWGLYAESLGDDMGLYDNPYSKFGQLTYEMWRAVRLVVDTGMHYFHWDRQRAINFFLENAAKQELDVVNEIDRYITMPGQALAYKIGQLKFRELRERARRELGAEFDVREYHDVALSSGAVPLDVLERQVNEWIAERKRRNAPRSSTR
ncbi:MAG TPA: DUF885 domain-containing protein [Pyrinomonadaceae bacterium]|nr:DUF885 domain-containing protein [Pyrinomonadaceae bacterium]